MRRTIFNQDHELYRLAAREFIEKEITPHHADWERDGVLSREAWLAAGAGGHLCHSVPEEHGGAGVDDFRFSVVLIEELGKALASGPGFTVHSEMVVPYIQDYASGDQKARWLPGCVTGELITAVAMTEPGTGSDLSAIETRAIRDGDDYVLNGTKTFISNGQLADLVIVVARTDSDPHRGLSLLAIERDMEGFERGRNLDKMGMKAQDTSELFFNDVRVPIANRIGEEGAGFFCLMSGLERERLSIAAGAVAVARRAFDETISYVRERKAFGRPIGKFQNSRFLMAETATELEIAQVFVDKCTMDLVAGRLTPDVAAMAKWWTTELQLRVIDRGVQLHGGYGYMMEYPIARMYADSRAQTIYGGTTEIMKELIGRGLGL
ncbi:MAG: acyl-CoA dehydrogenase family protein [Actinomycetota bacterium]|nr:acyl-CoA dehydrogenase family protein [Actinomycetota bacterium]